MGTLTALGSVDTVAIEDFLPSSLFKTRRFMRCAELLEVTTGSRCIAYTKAHSDSLCHSPIE